MQKKYWFLFGQFQVIDMIRIIIIIRLELP